MYDLLGRRVLVTGAAGGLGTELVRTLLRGGAEVCAVDVDAARGEALGQSLADLRDGEGRWSYLALDQSRPAAIAPALEAAGMAAADCLVNNAAIYPSTPAESVSDEEFGRVQAVNAAAAAAFARTCFPHMRARGWGRIVNVASITFDLGFEKLASYVASKGALIGLARVWAREFGRDGITVNAVSPGAFQTDAEKIHPDPEGYSRFVLDRQAIKRRGTPKDFANLVAFLLSEEAAFITGQTIRVDGGWVMA